MEIHGDWTRFVDKNGTEIKAGDVLYNPHDRDEYHRVLREFDDHAVRFPWIHIRMGCCWTRICLVDKDVW